MSYNFQVYEYHSTEICGNSNMSDYVRHTVDVGGIITLDGEEYAVSFQTGNRYYGNDYKLPISELDFYTDYDNRIIQFLVDHDYDDIDWESEESHPVSESDFISYKNALDDMLCAVNVWFKEYVNESDEMSDDPEDYERTSEYEHEWRFKK